MTNFQNPQNQTPLFNPANLESETSDMKHRKRISAGAIVRYDNALKRLRELLESGDFVAIVPKDFSTEFQITSNFLTALLRMKAIIRRSVKGKLYYKALEPFADVTAEKVGRELRQMNEESRVDIDTLNKKTTPDEVTVNLDSDVQITVTKDTSINEPQPTEEIFLVGILTNGQITAHTDPRCKFSDAEEASDSLYGFTCDYGSKLVILKVVEVVEPIRRLLPSTL